MKAIVAREVVSKPDAVLQVTRLITSQEWREGNAAAMKNGKAKGKMGWTGYVREGE